jgi:hypothetical protein
MPCSECQVADDGIMMLCSASVAESDKTELRNGSGRVTVAGAWGKSPQQIGQTDNAQLG